MKSQYFFNPLTYKQDNITPQSWTHYKSPLLMEISNIDKSWETVVITNVDEIAFVFSELKRGKETERNYQNRKTHFAITVRTKGVDGVITQYDGYLESYIRVGNQSISITDMLNDFIKEKLAPCP